MVLDDGTRKQILLKIWDAAGDTSVQNLAPLFLKNVSCCVLVYSINSSSSFDGLDAWYEAFENEGNDAINVLVGNKSDLDDHRSVPIAFG